MLSALNQQELFWTLISLVQFVHHAGRHEGVLGAVDKQHRFMIFLDLIQRTGLLEGVTVLQVVDCADDGHQWYWGMLYMDFAW